DAAQFADADVQVEVGQCLETVETDVDAFQGEDGAVAHIQALGRGAAETDGLAAGAGIAVGVERGFEHEFGYWSGAHHCSPFLRSKPITPLGRNSVTTMNRKPRANSQY